MTTKQDLETAPPIEDQVGSDLIETALEPEAAGNCRNGSVLKRIFCPQHGVMEGAEQQLMSETREILRMRLLAGSLILLLCLTLFSLRALIIDRFFSFEQIVTFFLLGGSALYVKYAKLPTLRKLRAVELLIFATMLIHLFLFNFQFVISMSGQAATSYLPTGIYRAAISFFALIVVYGMFIPNSWRRAALVIGVIAAAPAVLTTILWFGFPRLRPALEAALSIQDVSYTGLFIFVGSVIAIAGSHLVYQMRSNAAQMREMGMYQLQEKIGSGGMGEVWKAEHRLLARPAAIKMIRSDVLGANGNGQTDSLVSRFQREAQITASLRSPHTVELYDFGSTTEGTFYYVMEYLQGFDLDTLVDRFGPLPPERATYLLKQVAESLTEAHKKGLIHRDIKPSNIFVGPMGVLDDFVKVLDFGLVKALPHVDTDELKLTAEGTTTGTPAFMAPEVALGKTEINATSDIYALGCVGYWLLTGMLVFEGETAMEIVVNHVKTPPTPPSQRSEVEVPTCLDETILSCLAKDPAERPQEMPQLAEMLDACHLAEGWTQKKAEAWWKTHAPDSLN